MRTLIAAVAIQLALFLTGTASAAILPIFDRDQLCPAKEFIDKGARDDCWNEQQEDKRDLAQNLMDSPLLRLPDDRLMAYCIADATYHNTGYTGIAGCIERERHQELVEMVEGYFLKHGDKSDAACDKQKGSGHAGAYELCTYGQRQARHEFHDHRGVVAKEIVMRCAQSLVWAEFESCYIAKWNATRK